jgi:hypothetical protein
LTDDSGYADFGDFVGAEDEGHSGMLPDDGPPPIPVLVAGMLTMADGHDGAPLDYEALERWTRVGFERGMKSRKGER